MSEAERLRKAIRHCVEAVGDPLMSDIYSSVGKKWFRHETISSAVQSMVDSGELRVKEDLQDHDWSYRKGPNW